MSTHHVVPAQPGWFARHPGGPKMYVVAWLVAGDTLLPYLERSAGNPPALYTRQQIDEGAVEIGWEPPSPGHRMF